ncbi:hypothetical protein MMC25_004158 [Agyrium rufum]|nr:hypothetical protein [Agyrium rufum]
MGSDDQSPSSDSEPETQGFLPRHNPHHARSLRHSRRAWRSWLYSRVLLVATLITTFAISAQTLSGHFQAKEPPIMYSPCGSTPDEARSLGCTFDIISFSFLPPRCHDPELAAEFASLRQWEWFEDQNQTQPIPQEVALSGNYEGLYVNWDYHITHCVFMWRKMHRAFQRGGKSAIDGYIAPEAHTKHCGMMLVRQGVGLETVNTRIHVKYPECGMK